LAQKAGKQHFYRNNPTSCAPENKIFLLLSIYHRTLRQIVLSAICLMIV